MLQLLWNRIAYNGVSLLSDPSEQKNIVLLNSLAVTISFFSIGTLVISSLLLPEFFQVKFIPIGYAVLCFGTIYLNGRGWFVAARVYFGIISILFLIATSLIMGGPSNFHFYILTGMMLQFFIFPAGQRFWMLFEAMAFLTSFVVFELYFRETPGTLGLDGDEMSVMRTINAVGASLLNFGFAAYVSSTFHIAERYLNAEKDKSERLLLNILPASVAVKLRENPDTIAERFENCTILFSDIVGFTELSRHMPAVEVVGLLNEIFSAFDDLAEKYGLEKIKTIGDAYMVVGGLPEPHVEHAERVAQFALDMLEVVREYREKNDYPLELRVGISSGDAVAGVIGKKKFVYDLWGSNVNTASRMESHGLPGRVQVTESTYSLLKGKFRMEERGTIEVKGLGAIRSYLLLPDPI